MPDSTDAGPAPEFEAASVDRSNSLARVARGLAALPAGVAPSREMLADLRLGWDNDEWSADLDYLEELAERAARVSGPILECGSGMTTILLSTLAAKRGVEVWSFEHSPEWYLYAAAAICQLKLPLINLCLRPIRDYREFHWYALPEATLPRGFALIVCDGPPGTTKGGRYGLWPLLSGHFAPSAVIMLDDTNREKERAVLDRWVKASGGKTRVQGRFATLTLPR